MFPVEIRDDYDGDGQADLAVLTDLHIDSGPSPWKLLLVVPSSGACPSILVEDVHEGQSICAMALADIGDDDRPIVASDYQPVYVSDSLKAWCDHKR